MSEVLWNLLRDYHALCCQCELHHAPVCITSFSDEQSALFQAVDQSGDCARVDTIFTCKICGDEAATAREHEDDASLRCRDAEASHSLLCDHVPHGRTGDLASSPRFRQACSQ